MKAPKKILFWLFAVSVLVLVSEGYDAYNPSDSGDMGFLSFYIEIHKSNNGNVESSLHLAKYYEYNADFKSEYDVLVNLIRSKTRKTPSQWARILGSALENCHYSGLMSPEEVRLGFESAEKQEGLNETSMELQRRWGNGEFSKCPSK